MSTPEKLEFRGVDAAEVARQQGQRFVDAADKLRQRADTSTKALGAIATTLVTGIGIVKFSDVFPLPDDSVWVAYVVGFGFLLMAVAVAAFIGRSSKSSQPVFTSSDIDSMSGISRAERGIVSAVYRDMASLNNAPSLLAYEARAMQLERLAENIEDDAERLKNIERAQVIRAEVRSTQNRAATLIVRRRTASTVLGPRPWSFVALFLIGLVLAGVSSDWLESQRSSEIAIIKSCADAQKALNDAKAQAVLPTLCKTRQAGATPSEPSIPSEEQEDAALIAFLSDRLTGCVEASSRPDGASAEVCEQLKDGIREALEPPTPGASGVAAR